MKWPFFKARFIATCGLTCLATFFHVSFVCASANATGSESSAASTSSSVTNIVWSYWGDPWEKEINQKIIRVFESEHPHIRIKSRHLAYPEYSAAVQLWQQSNDMPDVLFLSHIDRYVATHSLASLTPFIERENYLLDDFYPQLLALFTANGQVYGFPRDNDTQVIFYNKRHFRRKNLEFPKCGWNWDDLLTTATGLTDKANGHYGFALQQEAIEQIYLQNREDGYRTEQNIEEHFFSSAAGQGALKLFLQIQREVSPPKVVTRSDQLAEAFMREQVSMIMGNHTLIPKIDTEVAWGVVCLPSGERRMNRLGGAGYSISQQSANKEAAWEFLSWLSGPTAQAIYAESISIFPARISVSNSDFYRRQVGSVNADVFLEEMRYAFYHGSFDERPQLNRNISDLLDFTLNKKMPFHEALSLICRRYPGTCVKGEENLYGD